MYERIWKRRHQLDRMTLGSLTIAFFQYPAVWAYLLLAGAGGTLSWLRPSTPLQTAAAALASGLVYPLVWYALHRWVLHSRWMFKSRLTASTWKRIHYDHHMDPNDLEVLFGALYTTLPTIALATVPIGWLIGGFGAAMAALAAGLLITCAYEFVHCIEHLPYKPRIRLLAIMKARHLAHHFHDENGNYGISNFAWDRLFGTLYERRDRPAKSPTVFNLGYDDTAARRYPWVSRISCAPARIRTVRPEGPRDPCQATKRLACPSIEGHCMSVAPYNSAGPVYCRDGRATCDSRRPDRQSNDSR